MKDFCSLYNSILYIISNGEMVPVMGQSAVMHKQGCTHIFIPSNLLIFSFTVA